MDGCGNHGCIIHKPVGMGTNSTCTCLRGLDTRKRLAVQRKIVALETEITRYRVAMARASQIADDDGIDEISDILYEALDHGAGK